MSKLGGGGGRIQMLISIETYIVIFQGVVWTPYPPSGSTHVMVFLKGFLKKVDFVKENQQTKKHANFQACKELMFTEKI